MFCFLLAILEYEQYFLFLGRKISQVCQNNNLSAQSKIPEENQF